MPPALSLSIGHRSGQDVVGLDIQPGFAAAVQARVNGVLLAERASVLRLSPEVMREGDVVDAVGLSESLRKLFAGAKLGKRVRVGVANQRTVMRTLELPPVTDAKDLAAAVQFQAQDQVPMPLANAVLDFLPLGVVETPVGPRQRVVLVAAQRDMVERLLTAVRGAGLSPVGVDMSAFALIRSLYSHNDDTGERVLYLNVDGLTNVAIAEGTICRFTRVLGGGMEELAAELAVRRGIPLEHARGLLADVDLTLPARDERSPRADEPQPPEPQHEDVQAQPDEHGQQPFSEPAAQADGADAQAASSAPADEPPAREELYSYAEELGSADQPSAEEDARAVLESGIRSIAGEVRNSLDFHRSQEGGAEASRVVLSGSALAVRGFGETLQSILGVEVQSKAISVGEAMDAGVMPARLAVAAGLATEGAAR